MNFQEVNELLNRYFDGETSLQEEAALRAYFNQPEVPASLRTWQPLFQYLESERSEQLDESFEVKLLEKIAATEHSGPRIRRLGYTLFLRAAAVALLALSTWWVYDTLQTEVAAEPVAETIDWSKYEPETPEEAYQILKTSLTKAANELNEGAQSAAQEMGKIRKMTDIMQ